MAYGMDNFVSWYPQCVCHYLPQFDKHCVAPKAFNGYCSFLVVPQSQSSVHTTIRPNLRTYPSMPLHSVVHPPFIKTHTTHKLPCNNCHPHHPEIPEIIPFCLSTSNEFIILEAEQRQSPTHRRKCVYNFSSFFSSLYIYIYFFFLFYPLRREYSVVCSCCTRADTHIPLLSGAMNVARHFGYLRGGHHCKEHPFLWKRHTKCAAYKYSSYSGLSSNIYTYYGKQQARIEWNAWKGSLLWLPTLQYISVYAPYLIPSCQLSVCLPLCIVHDIIATVPAMLDYTTRCCVYMS